MPPNVIHAVGASAMSSREAALRELASESSLLERILRTSRLQHRRGIYYQRLRGAYKRLVDALAGCAPSSLADADAFAEASAAVLRALGFVLMDRAHWEACITAGDGTAHACPGVHACWPSAAAPTEEAAATAAAMEPFPPSQVNQNG